LRYVWFPLVCLVTFPSVWLHLVSLRLLSLRFFFVTSRFHITIHFISLSSFFLSPLRHLPLIIPPFLVAPHLPYCIRVGVHVPTKSVSVPAAISLLPPVQPRSSVHAYRQNRYRRFQGGQFRECCRAVNKASMWNRRFYLMCLLHLRKRRSLKRKKGKLESIL
jgi:hypothetical protein